MDASSCSFLSFFYKKNHTAIFFFFLVLIARACSFSFSISILGQKESPDWKTITGAKQIFPPAYDPKEEDIMGDELGDSTTEPVVELKCKFSV